jgi:hypothetical protein
VFCFATAGYILTSDVAVAGLHIGGWPAVSWIYTIPGVIWYPVWCLFAYETPEDHPTIHPNEISIIRMNQLYTTLAEVERDIIENNEQERQSRQGDRNSNLSTQRLTLTSPKKERESEIALLPPVALGSSRLTDSGRLRSTDAARLRLTSMKDPRLSEISSVRESIVVPQNPQEQQEIAKRIPWGAFLTNPVSLTIIVVYATFFWTSKFSLFLLLALTTILALMIQAEIPSYLTDVLGYTHSLNLHAIELCDCYL